MKVKIEEHPNPDRLSFHLSKMITRKHIVTFDAPEHADLPDSSDGPCSRTEELRYIAGALFVVEGVSSVTFEPYEISLGKSSASDWDEMIPDILHVIKTMIAKGESVEEKPRITMTDEERKRIIAQYNSDLRDFHFDD